MGDLQVNFMLLIEHARAVPPAAMHCLCPMAERAAKAIQRHITL